MRLRKLKFDKENTTIKSVTVTMSVEEATFMAKLLGKQSSASANDVLGTNNNAGAALSHEMYDCLVDEVFNCHYDNGVDEVIAELFHDSQPA